MIEYALLFGLGFVTAALAGLLLAPAIYRRIVKFTEDRIMATMPVSPQELRAQKDMVRAEMAVAVAKTGQELKAERDRVVTLSLANEGISAEVQRLHGENDDLRRQIGERETEAAEMRAALRQEEIHIDNLRQSLAQAQHSDRLKDTRVLELLQRVQRLVADLDNMRIDLATRDTEIAGMHARINALRDERETLRNDLRLASQRAKDAELRLAREEHKAIRLEEKLNREISGSVDKDTVIERRISEINRLKERLKTANASIREATRTPKSPASARVTTLSRSRSSKVEPLAEATEPVDELADTPVAETITAPPSMISEEAAVRLSDEARSQANAVSDQLVSHDGAGVDDDAVRAEIADIAAKMVAVVAQKEGRSSPIWPMISANQPDAGLDRVSLAERSALLLKPGRAE
ncbi:coiled-coil domain-containing protein [Rhizobium alvei]|uniref:Chromosome segregation ATPase n=1 Tax=Rhizobium alvei TaxID=1132659 RepID=A0ABT8YLU2_9HYPH|nr:hypothetical protein [Rhizobium alvei]MDO6964461.1 hypothetical protein [Rhizobium alvei]